MSLAAAAELFNSAGNLESSHEEYWGVLRSLCRHLEGGTVGLELSLSVCGRKVRLARRKARRVAGPRLG